MNASPAEPVRRGWPNAPTSSRGAAAGVSGSRDTAIPSRCPRSSPLPRNARLPEQRVPGHPSSCCRCAVTAPAGEHQPARVCWEPEPAPDAGEKGLGSAPGPGSSPRAAERPLRPPRAEPQHRERFSRSARAATGEPGAGVTHGCISQLLQPLRGCVPPGLFLSQLFRGCVPPGLFVCSAQTKEKPGQ